MRWISAPLGGLERVAGLPLAGDGGALSQTGNPARSSLIHLVGDPSAEDATHEHRVLAGTAL